MSEEDFYKYMKMRQQAAEEAKYTSTTPPGRMPDLTGVSFKAAKEGKNIRAMILYENKEIGSLDIGEDVMAAGTASRMFPEKVKKDDKVYRVYGIEIEDEFQGRGWGKMLYLFGYNQFPGGKFYNSQAWEPAIYTLQSLKKEGWIELYWRGSMGGVHVSWLTESGKAKARELEKLKPPPKKKPGFLSKIYSKIFPVLDPTDVGDNIVRLTDNPEHWNLILGKIMNRKFRPYSPVPHLDYATLRGPDGETVSELLIIRGPSEDESRSGVFVQDQAYKTAKEVIELIYQDPRLKELLPSVR